VYAIRYTRDSLYNGQIKETEFGLLYILYIRVNECLWNYSAN